MFLVKIPKWLIFSNEKYEENVTKVSCLEVRNNGIHSNARIIKYKDGSYCLKVGKYKCMLRMVDLQYPICLAEKNNLKVDLNSESDLNQSNKDFVVGKSINKKMFIGKYNER